MKFEIQKFRWSDVDANMHIKNTAYNDLFIQSRLSFLKQMGFGMKEFKQYGFGPMVIHEHIFYIKEVRAESEVYIDMKLRGSSEDGKFMQFAQHMYNNEGDLCCYMDLTFGWLDTKARKLAVPMPKLLEAINSMEKTEDYRLIDSSDFRAAHVPYGKKIDLNSL